MGQTLKGVNYELDDEDDQVSIQMFVAQMCAGGGTSGRNSEAGVVSPTHVTSSLGRGKPGQVSRRNWDREYGWRRLRGLYTPKRSFPHKMVAGAEEVLARLLLEIDVSKTFTPLGLGEIIAVRSHDANGRVNKYAQGNKKKDILEFKQDDVEWNPVNTERARPRSEFRKAHQRRVRS